MPEDLSLEFVFAIALIRSRNREGQSKRGVAPGRTYRWVYHDRIPIEMVDSKWTIQEMVWSIVDMVLLWLVTRNCISGHSS